MSRHQLFRASDADRDTVVDRLRRAAGEGRLEPDELEDRVDAALRARTYGELDWLVADLPRTDVVQRRRSRKRSLARTTMMGVGALAAVSVALVAVAVVALLFLAAAAWWVFFVALWIVCRGAGRRRSAWHYRAAPFRGRWGT